MSTSDILNQLVNTPTNGLFGIDVGQKQLNEGRPSPVVQGEDGQMYLANEYLDDNGNWQINPDFSTPVYYFHQPLEGGDARGIYAEYSDDLQSADQQGFWRTEEEIKAYWDGEGATDMNMFKQANPDMDFDTYMSFIKENSALYSQGITPDSDPDAFSGITEKYGIQTSITDNDNVYGWNGSNYTKTFKPDDPEYGRMLWGAGLGALTAGALGPVIGGATGAAPAGFVGPLSTSQIVGGKLASGIAAGIGSAAAQGALTGSIDPRSVLSSAVIAGLNPGGYVADNWIPGIDNRIGSPTQGEWVLGGTGQGFLNGQIAGTINDVVSQGITTGSVDLEDALLSGALQGGKQSFMDALYDADYYSQEKIAARMMMADPNLTYEQAMANALNDPSYLKTNLGAIIGEGGLLPFIPELDLSGVAGVYNNFDGMLGGILPDIFDPDSPYSGKTAEEIATRRQELSAEWWKDNQDNPAYFDSNGAMTPAGVRAQYDYINANFDPNWAYFHGVTGLDEKYSWSPNDRGDTEIYGTAVQATDEYGNPIYTSGTAYETVYTYDADGNIKKNEFGNPAGGYSSVMSPVDVNWGGGNDLIMYLNSATLPSTSSTPGFWDAVRIGIADGWVTANSNDNKTVSVTDSAGNSVVVSASDFNQNITGGGADVSTDLVNTGDTVTNTGVDTTTNSGVDTTVNTGGDLTTNTGNLDANAGGDLTSNTGGVGDSATTSGDDLASSDGTVTTNDDLSKTDSTINTGDELASGTSDELSASYGSDVLPKNEGLFPSSDGLPPLWSELYGYSKISPYKGARLQILNDIVSGLNGQGMMTPKIVNEPYMKLNRDLLDAGILS